MSSHSFTQGAERGIQLVVRLYPWSVLWVLAAIAMVLIVQGSWMTIALFVGLILIVTAHSLHRDHIDHQRRNP